MKLSTLPLIAAFSIAFSAAHAQQAGTEIAIGLANCCKAGDTFQDANVATVQEAAKNAGVKIIYASANESETDDRSLQAKQVEDMIKQGAKAIVISLARGSTKDHEKILEIAKQKNIPVVAYTREPSKALMKKYKNLYFIGSILSQAGIFQGEVIADDWQKNSQFDKNKDGILQYAILKGPNGAKDSEAELRTAWVAKTLELTIKSEKIALESADWDRARAKKIIERWHNGGLLDQIEVLICNNDDMALGAIDYFSANNISLPVYGVDGTQIALDAMEKGKMQGTIFQNGKKQSGTAFKIAKNLAEGKDASEDLQDVLYVKESRKVTIPFEKITKANFKQYKD